MRSKRSKDSIETLRNIFNDFVLCFVKYVWNKMSFLCVCDATYKKFTELHVYIIYIYIYIYINDSLWPSCCHVFK